MPISLMLNEEQEKQLHALKNYYCLDSLDETFDKVLKGYSLSNRIPNQFTINAFYDDLYDLVTLDEFRGMLQ